MANVNKIILVGTITEKPNVRFGMENNLSVANFNIATARPTRADGTAEEDIVPVVAFGKNADYVAEYLNQGSVAIIEGRIQVRTVDKDGQREWITEVAASSVKNIDVKKDNTKAASSKSTTLAEPAPAIGQNPFEGSASTEDDVPF